MNASGVGVHWWRIPLDEYKGLVAHAYPGTHPTAAEMLDAAGIKGGPALDLAAGSGALIARLRDQGVGPFDAIELNPQEFGLSDHTPLQIDLNKEFAPLLDKEYQLVTATEIIEHLDNPRLFLERIHRVLSPGGYALISTPNIAHWSSRIRFLLTGFPKWFRPSDMEEQRHINPILLHHFLLMIKETGFEVVSFRCTGACWGLVIRLLVRPVELLFRILGNHAVEGNTNIFLLRKI